MAEKDFKKTLIRDRGPGPGAYMLPSLVGYVNHGLTKRRYPAYSMGKRLGVSGTACGVGPAYYIERNLTRFGKNGTPAFSMGVSLSGIKNKQVTPGPGAYAPDYEVIYNRGPLFSLGQRTGLGKGNPTPAPNAYKIHSYIGPRVIDKESAPAYSMGIATSMKSLAGSPGPAAYAIPNLSAFRYRPPIYSMGIKPEGARRSVVNPGPAAYLPKSLGRGPAFCFGIKHSEYSAPLILEEDN